MRKNVFVLLRHIYLVHCRHRRSTARSRPPCNIHCGSALFLYSFVLLLIANLIASCSLFPSYKHTRHNRSCPFFGFLWTTFFARVVSQLNLVTPPGARRTERPRNTLFHGGSESAHQCNLIYSSGLLTWTREVSLVASRNKPYTGIRR